MKVVAVCIQTLMTAWAVESVYAAAAVRDIWEEEGSRNGIDGGRGVEESGISRLPRVLNFFPVPVEEECVPKVGKRNGVCMNTYECRIFGGRSSGFCALGFGVCCVLTATCKQRVETNITYFINPDYPDLTVGMTECSLTIKKMDPEIAQLRLDFLHFNLGQPNRRTGVCEDDVFRLTSTNTSRELILCGLNSGQHVYYDVENVNEVTISMKLSRRAVARVWEVRILQIPFTQRAPAGCLQYHEGKTGTIQTMNFADNGRHLAEQDYNICIRQEADMCSIAYEPCHENSFRISPNRQPGQGEDTALVEDEGSGDGNNGRAMEDTYCGDKIVLPCDAEDLFLPGDMGFLPSLCDLAHCGPTLCPSGQTPCRVETSATPFTVGVHFGPSAREASPEDNLGMCLMYEQLPCEEV